MLGSLDFWLRLKALIDKETHQMLRDKSNLMVGLLLPVALVLLFGYGLSFDVKDAPIAMVIDNPTPTTNEVLAGFQGSQYLIPIRVDSMKQAEKLLNEGEVRAIVHLPTDFTSMLASNQAHIQLIVNGTDTMTAQSMQSYVAGALASYQAQKEGRLGFSGSLDGQKMQTGQVKMIERMWFNAAGNSRWYLVPGLVVLVMTLIGAFLTSLLIAREWERGTLESLFVTPVRPIEIMLSKLAPYMVIGLIDLLMCLVASRWLFDVPIRGSLVVIISASMLYLLSSLLTGLLISALTRNQFQSSQMAMLASFMPAMMLSGFVFDLRNLPTVIQIISHLLPATYFMQLCKTLFLAGNYWPMIIKNCLILLGFVVFLAVVVTRKLKKSLDGL